MKKTKFILSIAIAVVSVGCILVLLYFVIAERRNAKNLNDATEFFRKGNYEKALPLLNEIVRQDPTSESAYRMLAKISESEYNFAAALQYYRQIKDLNALDPEVQLKYVECLSAIGEFKTIINELKTRFENNKLSTSELFYYLEALVATGKTKEAKARLAKPGGLASDQISYLNGMIELRDNHTSKAFEILRQTDPAKLPFSIHARLLSALGGAAEVSGDKIASEKAYTELAKTAPMTGPYLLARFYSRQGKSEQYLEWLKKAVSLNPLHMAARIDLAEYYAAEKDANSLNKLIRNPSNRSEAEALSYIRAMSSFLDKRYADAAKQLNVATPFAERPLYLAMKLQCLINAEDVEKIPACINALLAIQATPEAKSRLTNELYPLLLKLYQNNEFGKANKVAKVVLTLSNKQTSPARTLALAIDLQDAITAGDPAQTGVRLNTLLAEAPNNQFANLIAGNLLLGSNLPERALVHFKRVPEDNAAAQFGAARAEMALGKNEDAEKSFAKAWSIVPGSTAVFATYSEFLNNIKRGDQIEKLIPQLPDTPEARFLTAIARANRSTGANQPDEARKFHLAALNELDEMPSTPLNEYRRANLFALTDQDAKAETAYDKLLKSFPRWLPVLVNQSEVKASLGKHKEALELAQRAVRVAPNSDAAKLCLKRRIAETRK
ncbi:MAG: tetratricopeptide repeat protein [Victivallales bacterium]|jgi:tetratricopeptide (TPR) repeat protein|nr:tetratricopeptide repeat protein [Victivallales bacterium]